MRKDLLSRLNTRLCGFTHTSGLDPWTVRGRPRLSSSSALVALDRARLSFPGSSSSTAPLDLSIGPAGTGGHVLLGRNGTGKSLLSGALVHGEGWLAGGALHRHADWRARSVSQVSFESHEALVAEGGTVFHAVGHMSAAAKFLIVRFGLYRLLYRPVDAISTGEIRKLLLARALATRPELLLLDNPYDGLDAPSRAVVLDLLSTTLRGFGQLLVQGVDAAATARTQVLLVTHRPEEIVDEITTVHTIGGEGEGGAALTSSARAGRAAAELVDRAMLPPSGSGEGTGLAGPSAEEVRRLWRAAGGGGAAASARTPIALVEADGLRVHRDEARLLDLSWRVRRGEHWLVAGGNGAGKSTLSRLLAVADAAAHGAEGRLEVLGGSPSRAANGPPGGRLRALRDGVGWVSTERHLELSARLAGSSTRAAEVLGSFGAAAEGGAAAAARWLALPAPLLARPFCALSQGEQKLVLLGTALARAPALLVLDEPCQGLDPPSRRRVLDVVQRVCAAAEVALVFVTHHRDEVPPCVTHVLHLEGGAAKYAGERAEYEARS
jgi:molybdate transport system ATP-binding protein